MICLGVASKAFLSAKEKSQDLAALGIALNTAKIELQDTQRLERKVTSLIPLPQMGYTPAKAEELMVSAIVEMPRMAESYGMQVLKIETAGRSAAGTPLRNLMKGIPITDRIQQGEVKISARFNDLWSMRSFLQSVEDMRGYVLNGKIRNNEAEFSIGFLGV